MWDNALGKSMSEDIKELITTIAGHEMERLTARPDLTERVEMLGRRKAERFGAEMFGITPAPRFATVYDFFDDYLSVAYEGLPFRENSRWCGQWWRHRGVLMRVTAMWRGYEELRITDPLTVDEKFLRTIGDHHMRALTGDQSPMENCDISGHTIPNALKSTPMEEDSSNG